MSGRGGCSASWQLIKQQTLPTCLGIIISPGSSGVAVFVIYMLELKVSLLFSGFILSSRLNLTACFQLNFLKQLLTGFQQMTSHHRLPVGLRSDLKILLITFKACEGLALTESLTRRCFCHQDPSTLLLNHFLKLTFTDRLFLLYCF